MPSADLIKTNCPHCGKGIGVRPDQVGRRLRCPACRLSFQIERPEPLPPPPPAPEPTASPPAESYWSPAPEPEAIAPPPDEVFWSPADEANELARAAPPPRAWAKAKLTATFPRSRQLTLQAAVQAIRGCRCEIVQLDRANGHVRFSFDAGGGRGGEHDLFVFDGRGGSAEIDISSHDPNEEDVFDPYYQAIAREVGKYLHFAAEPEPLPLPPARDERPDPPRRRRRRERAGSDPLAIAGFVCGIVGVVLFCIPLLGGGLGTLGVVFGAIGMGKGKSGQKGFAVAALTLGIIACLLSFIVFCVYVDDADRRHRW